MIASQLISDSFPPLRLSDSAATAINLMQEFGLEILPIVEKGKYIGVVTDESILDIENLELPLSEAGYAFLHPSVTEDMHIFGVLKIVAEQNLSIVPVVSKENSYLGAVTLQSLLRYFTQLSGLTDPGAVLILQIPIRDFALSQVSRITESNDIQVLALYVNLIQDRSIAEITLKLNKTDLASLIATFERFNYTITASFQESEYFNDLKDRYDSFMKYMSI